jgi:hypothetical protein
MFTASGPVLGNPVPALAMDAADFIERLINSEELAMI